MDELLSMAIADVPLFAELNRDEMALIEGHLVYRKIKAGATIYKQGSHADSVCFVVDGEMEVIKQEGPGKEVKVATLRKGQAVGEMAIIDGLTRSATIRARTVCSVLILKRVEFNRVVDNHPLISVKILKGLARMLSSNLRQTSDAFSKMMISIS